MIWGLTLTILSIVWFFGQGLRHLVNAVPAFAIIGSIWLIELQNIFLISFFILVSVKFFIIENL